MIVYVVCDANGECKGVFQSKELANRVAAACAAYVSEHTLGSSEEEWQENYTLQTVGGYKKR